MTNFLSFDTSENAGITVLYVSSATQNLASTMLSTDRISATVRSDTDSALDAIGPEIDCVVATHDPPAIDAPELQRRLQAAGHEQPFLLYGPKVRASVVETVIELGGDYLCSNSDTASRTVLAKRIQTAVDDNRTRSELEIKSRAMEQAPVGITIADATVGDEPLIYINEQFETMTGYPVSEALGENCRFLQGPATNEETVAEIRSAVEQREPASVELLNYRRDMTPFWNQLDIAPVSDGKRVTHFFGFQKDITDKKTITEDLHHQVELQNRFASIISHDLRNPLTLAKGHLEMAIDDHDDPNLDEIEYALNRMDELIDSVLTMARHGTAILDPETVELAAVVERASDVVDCRVEIMDTLPTPKGAPDRLATLFENLFRNSVEHGTTADRSQIDDAFAVRVGAIDGGFYVEDDGPGIPDSERESVFEWGVTMSESGTGYGLAIVETIARAHGWDVTVTDGTTGGARFEFAIGARPTVMD